MFDGLCATITTRTRLTDGIQVTAPKDKRPPGRPTLPPEEAQTSMIRERVTGRQRQEYESRGGKAWLVAALNRKRK